MGWCFSDVRWTFIFRFSLTSMDSVGWNVNTTQQAVSLESIVPDR